MRFVLITAAGTDRPGLVAAVAGALRDHGWNIEDASMTRLRGDFAMMLLARHTDAPAEPLRAALQAVGANVGLTLTLRELSEAETQPPPDEGDSFHVSVYGADRAGIVHAITQRLAERGADITDLRTSVAGTSAAPIYVMQIEALAAPDEDADAFAAALKDAGAALGVDVGVLRLDPVVL